MFFGVTLGQLPSVKCVQHVKPGYTHTFKRSFPLSGSLTTQRSGSGSVCKKCRTQDAS
jgi:hypothetical protein